MKGNRKRDTRPEVALRSALHRLGLRFRHDYAVRVPGRRPIRIDIAFPGPKVAVFVDGCFWHRCPAHGTTPAANRSYWQPKLDRNVQRDREVDEALVAAGWLPVHVWEHEDPAAVAPVIAATVARRRPAARRPSEVARKGVAFD
jgi:DNA mismatch endonuclease, patch repair protein